MIGSFLLGDQYSMYTTKSGMTTLAVYFKLKISDDNVFIKIYDASDNGHFDNIELGEFLQEYSEFEVEVIDMLQKSAELMA